MNLTVIDSHIHFWDPHYLQYDWLAEVPAINTRFLPEDLLVQSTSIDLEKIVFVQCDCLPAQGLEEVQWVTKMAQQEARIQAIVAFAPLEQGEAVREHLGALANYPLVKGVRRLIQSEGPGFSLQSDFVAGVQSLADFDFSFDICVKHDQLDDVLKLVEQCPQVTFVLDHIGKPDIKAGQLEPWRTQITKLAGFPNVHCKISGLVTEADLDQWSQSDLRPYIDHVIEAFGVDRIMYGGDWPVSLLASTYQAWLETLYWAVEGLSTDDKTKLFYRNAANFYRLG